MQDPKRLFLTGDSGSTAAIPDGSVSLTVTSPPSLTRSSMRRITGCGAGLMGIDAAAIERGLTVTRSLADWCNAMGTMRFSELFRVTAYWRVCRVSKSESTGSIRWMNRCFLVPLRRICASWHPRQPPAVYQNIPYLGDREQRIGYEYQQDRSLQERGMRGKGVTLSDTRMRRVLPLPLPLPQ